MRLFSAFLFASLFGFGPAELAFAAKTEPDVLSVSAERTHKAYGGQTISLVIDNQKEKEKRKATLFVSSNFIGPPREHVRLGHFETHELTRMELDRQTLVSWQVGLAEEKAEFADSVRLKKGETRAFVGGFRLDPYAPQRSDALTFLERVWDIATWLPVDAVHVSKAAGKDTVVLRYKGRLTFRERKSTQELGCKKETSADGKPRALVCVIPKFGTAYLVP